MSDYIDPTFKDLGQESVNNSEDNVKKQEHSEHVVEDDPMVALAKKIQGGDEFLELQSFQDQMPKTQKDEDELQLGDQKDEDGGGDLDLLQFLNDLPDVPNKGTKDDVVEDDFDLEARLRMLQEDAPVQQDNVITEVTGQLAGFEVDTALDLTQEETQGTHPIYTVELNSKKYYLKEVSATKDEEEGLNAQAVHGITVPGHVKIEMSDGKTYQVTEGIKFLREGLSNITWYTDDEKTTLDPSKKQLLVDLGIQHIADIRVCNVDRLPWEGNNYKANMKNVFMDMWTGKLLGLDTEADTQITREKEEDIEKELLAIGENPETCAATIFDVISKKGKTGIVDAEELKKEDFVEVFASGLKKGLKVDYKSPYRE